MRITSDLKGGYMANVFSAAEIIDMGIVKEKKRRDFYGLAADKFKEKDMKELFSRLRDWEDEHIKRFTDIRKSTETYEVQESFQGEFAAYMKFVVDDMLYMQISAGWFAKNVKEPLIAVQYGIGFEKDAILFFSELLKYMMGPNKEKVEELIGEEKKHLVYLAELKAKYTK
jgi:rubrerythrin